MMMELNGEIGMPSKYNTEVMKFFESFVPYKKKLITCKSGLLPEIHLLQVLLQSNLSKKVFCQTTCSGCWLPAQQDQSNWLVDRAKIHFFACVWNWDYCTWFGPSHAPFIIWSFTNQFYLLQGRKSVLDVCVKNQLRPMRRVLNSDLACNSLEC